jgi:hypothetical protein
MNAASMNDSQRAAQGGLSVLSLRFEVVDDRPDWPVVRVLVDGRDPFAAVAPGWRGFDPAEILGPDSPLLPADQGRRVAVYCCSCGEPGCGVIAPVIFPSPDGRRVARLLYERLEPLKLVLPPGLGLARAWPAWSRNGLVLMFQRVIGGPQPAVDQQMLRLTSTLSDPDQAAEDMAQQLLSTRPDDWVDSFGQSPED